MDDSKGIVIFDLDDCLIMTVHWYWAGWQMFKDVMVKLGFKEHEAELIDKLNEFDAAGVKKHGFKKERFGEAMMETYEHYCQVDGRDIDPDTMDGLFDIGMSVYAHKQIMYPGAKDVLAYLSDQGYLLYCVTKGDRDVQIEKIVGCEIEHFFQDVQYVPLDKKKAIESIIARHENMPLERFFFVGNSWKDDMRPAIELGINAMLIYEYTWHWDEADFPGKDKVRELKGLLDLKEIL